MSAIVKSAKHSFRCMNRVLGIQHYGKIMPSIQINIRTFAGGHGDDVVSNTPGYDQGQNDVNNPFLWDPHYQPAEESDFDRDPQEVRLRQPLPRESFVPSDEVMGRIQHILRGMERAQTDGKTMNMTTHLANDLGLDSLDQVEFGLALEDEFDIEIPDEEAEQIVTLGDAVELIADHPHAK